MISVPAATVRVAHDHGYQIMMLKCLHKQDCGTGKKQSGFPQVFDSQSVNGQSSAFASISCSTNILHAHSVCEARDYDNERTLVDIRNEVSASVTPKASDRTQKSQATPEAVGGQTHQERPGALATSVL